jgi:ABC-2 type transport system ATP-binding protein
MFEVRSLHKHYLGIPALDHVSFVARPGEVTGYLGANGSGNIYRDEVGHRAH